jgi:hypothetical protein
MEYWESRFKNEGTMWKFEPSDSALKALNLFKSEKIKKILIPGFGYGRNGKMFIDNGFDVTGIEISGSAIDLARANGMICKMHHGSVTSMPFDNEIFEGIFCYALIHVLNRNERRIFLQSCYDQLNFNGLMIFVVASKNSDMYKRGRYLSRDRFELSRGLQVYFYDIESVKREFSAFNIVEINDIDEPVKFMKDQDPVKMIYVTCRKR